MRIYRVLRTNHGHIAVEEGDRVQWFSLHDLAQAVETRLREAGSRNLAFDTPPFFFTGSPYGEAILALGVAETEPPKTEFWIEVVPLDGVKPWTAREPIWPAVFNVDPSLYWWKPA